MTMPAFQSESNDRAAPISDRCASELLALGIMGDRRPIDDVIDRVRQPDGAEWLKSIFPWNQTGGKRPGAKASLGGGHKLGELRRRIDEAKSSMAEVRTCDEAVEATATYFFTLALGMAHFGVVLSSRLREDLDIALVDLADVCPPRWANLLRQAAETCPVSEENESEQKE